MAAAVQAPPVSLVLPACRAGARGRFPGCHLGSRQPAQGRRCPPLPPQPVPHRGSLLLPPAPATLGAAVCQTPVQREAPGHFFFGGKSAILIKSASRPLNRNGPIWGGFLFSLFRLYRTRRATRSRRGRGSPRGAGLSLQPSRGRAGVSAVSDRLPSLFIPIS